MGETSRADWDGKNSVWSSGMLHLPWKIELSTNFDVRSGQPYNTRTRTDANGEGVFIDRPSYATATASDLQSGRIAESAGWRWGIAGPAD